MRLRHCTAAMGDKVEAVVSSKVEECTMVEDGSTALVPFSYARCVCVCVCHLPVLASIVAPRAAKPSVARGYMRLLAAFRVVTRSDLLTARSTIPRSRKPGCSTMTANS